MADHVLIKGGAEPSTFSSGEDAGLVTEIYTAFAAKLGVQGTPTLIIDGWKLAQPPGPEELDRMVKAILAGKSPISVDEKP